MLHLAEFDWEYAQILDVALELTGGVLTVHVGGARIGDRRSVDATLEFREIAYLAMIRDKSRDLLPTEIKELSEWEGVRTLMVERGENGEFIQMNFIDGWSRAAPRAGSFDSYNTYFLAAGAITLEWISGSLEVTFV